MNEILIFYFHTVLKSSAVDYRYYILFSKMPSKIQGFKDKKIFFPRKEKSFPSTLSRGLSDNLYICLMWKYLLVVILAINMFPLSAQQNSSAPLSIIILEEEVQQQFNFWQKQQQSVSTFSAWRVLVAGLRDRRSLNAIIERFEEEFPKLDYDWEYDSPLYKLKTGIQTERLDIKPLLHQIREHFPSALEIKDEVSYEEYFKLRS